MGGGESGQGRRGEWGKGVRKRERKKKWNKDGYEATTTKKKLQRNKIKFSPYLTE